MFDSLHAVCADEVDAIADCAYPLAVAAVDGYTVDWHLIEEVVTESRTIIARHYDLREGKSALKDLVRHACHEDSLFATNPDVSVEVFGGAVVEVGQI